MNAARTMDSSRCSRLATGRALYRARLGWAGDDKVQMVLQVVTDWRYHQGAHETIDSALGEDLYWH